MGGRVPEPATDLSELVAAARERVPVLVFGSQECSASIERSLLSPQKLAWEARLKREIGDEYVMLTSENLAALHLCIFVRKNLQRRCRAIRAEKVVTGVGNVIANKGALVIGFQIDQTRLLFVNCHLAAGQSKVADRNNGVRRIRKELRQLLNEPKRLDHNTRPVQPYDYVFWFGDLNYRVSGPRDAVFARLKEGRIDALLEMDQLTTERRKGHVFGEFDEAGITFLPTYKFDLGAKHYASVAAQRVPSWTDRILFKAIKHAHHAV
ncbi:hypothetical protein CXG81DRAFT_8682, partial [Caulochytrium protostelioides]